MKIIDNGNTVQLINDNGRYSCQGIDGMTDIKHQLYFYKVLIHNDNHINSNAFIGVAHKYLDKEDRNNYNKDYTFCLDTSNGDLRHSNSQKTQYTSPIKIGNEIGVLLDTSIGALSFYQNKNTYSLKKISNSQKKSTILLLLVGIRMISIHLLFQQ